MNNRHKAIAIFILVAFVILAAWALRYEYIPADAGSASHGIVYRANRWTGEIQMIHGSRIMKAAEEK